MNDNYMETIESHTKKETKIRREDRVKMGVGKLEIQEWRILMKNGVE